MTHVTCRLTAKNRDQLRNPTLEYGLPFYTLPTTFGGSAVFYEISASNRLDVAELR